MAKTVVRILGVLVALGVLALVPRLVGDPYQLHILIMVLLGVTLALGLQLLMTVGQVSFAHASFWAIGAYTSSLLMLKLHWSFWVGLPAAGIVAGLVALIIGYPCLRLKGPYFFMVTLAFGEAVLLVFKSWVNPFGGMNGLSSIPRPGPIDFFGLFTMTFTSKTAFYYLSMILALLAVFVAYRLQKSRFGAESVAIRDADSLAQAVGVNMMKRKVLVFVIGTVFAGLAGAIYASYVTFINPDLFTFWNSMTFLLFVVVGGSGSIWGVIIGAFILTAAPEVFRVAKRAEPSIYGAILVMVLLFLPGGLITLPQRLPRFLQFWRGWGAQKEEARSRAAS